MTGLFFIEDKLYQTYSSDSRFAMIGIVPGPKSNPIIRVMMREMALPWPVGYAGAQKASMIMRKFGDGNMGTWNVLVGADGKIIAVSLKGEELHKKLEEALAAQQARQQPQHPPAEPPQQQYPPPGR